MARQLRGVAPLGRASSNSQMSYYLFRLILRPIARRHARVFVFFNRIERHGNTCTMHSLAEFDAPKTRFVATSTAERQRRCRKQTKATSRRLALFADVPVTMHHERHPNFVEDFRC